VAPDHVQGGALLGVSLARLGQGAAAKPFLEQATRADPDFAQGHELLAEWAVAAGEVDEAIARYNKVVSLRPDDEAVRAKLRALRAKKP
jgi:Tfp pilus assembly protein PilF